MKKGIVAATVVFCVLFSSAFAVAEKVDVFTFLDRFYWNALKIEEVYGTEIVDSSLHPHIQKLSNSYVATLPCGSVMLSSEDLCVEQMIVVMTDLSASDEENSQNYMSTVAAFQSLEGEKGEDQFFDSAEKFLNNIGYAISSTDLLSTLKIGESKCLYVGNYKYYVVVQKIDIDANNTATVISIEIRAK